MIDKREYFSLMRRMVAEVLPEELAAFELSGEHVAQQLFAGHAPSIGTGSAAEFQFIDNVTDVLTFVGLMIGTLEGLWKIADRLKKAGRSSTTEDELAAQWKQHLLMHAVDEQVANAAVKRFRDDILALAKRDG